jgi:small subunit ribosomal protein S35
LTELAKPFEPPKQNQPLRFRYTTYFGAQHPADKKVVVEFAPKDITDLTDIQRMKMIKLAGVRYNPSTGLIKISSESMETQAQNKRYLGDLVSKLIKESKDPKDTFEDVPVDFRHHTPKPFHRLPERWKLTPERKRQLEEKRTKLLEDERMKKDTGKLVDGVGVIEQAMKRLGMAQLQEKKNAISGAKVPVPVARRGVVGRGKVGQPLPGKK